MYSLPFRNLTKEDIDKQRQDTTWHKCHSFHKGYFWKRHSDDVDIYEYDLDALDIPFDDFPTLPIDIIENIVSQIKEYYRLQKEKSKRYEVPKCDDGKFPKINKTFPEIDIRSIICDNPIIGEYHE